MKKIFLLALFATLFFACAKEPQSTSLPEQESLHSIQNGESTTQTFIASDRETAAYFFGLTNSTLFEYCFRVDVVDVETGLTVWRQGGCYTGNQFHLLWLVPGKMYAATLRVTSPYPGQQGKIHWSLRNIGSSTICSEGNVNIIDPTPPLPLPTGLPWPACL